MGMVEQVARAIYDKSLGNGFWPDWEDADDASVSAYTSMATAALEAIGDQDDHMFFLAERAVEGGQSRGSFSQLAEWAYDQASTDKSIQESGE